MKDKPTASGDWTAEWLRDQIPPHYSNDSIALQICHMHNAALADQKRELWEKISLSRMEADNWKGLYLKLVAELQQKK